MPLCLFNAIRTHRWPAGPCLMIPVVYQKRNKEEGAIISYEVVVQREVNFTLPSTFISSRIQEMIGADDFHCISSSRQPTAGLINANARTITPTAPSQWRMDGQEEDKDEE